MSLWWALRVLQKGKGESKYKFVICDQPYSNLKVEGWVYCIASSFFQ